MHAGNSGSLADGLASHRATPAVTCTGPHRLSAGVTTNLTAHRKQRFGAWISRPIRVAYGGWTTNFGTGDSTMRAYGKRTFVLACSMAAAAVIVGAVSLIISRPAAATAQFARDTGKVCGDCHTAATGGGPLTPFGEKFKANGNKMPKWLLSRQSRAIRPRSQRCGTAAN